MVLNIPLEVGFLALHHVCQQKVNQNLIQQNKKRWSFDYVVGQQVLVRAKNGLS